MQTLLIIAMLFGLWAVPSNDAAQGVNAQERTRQIVAAFNKSKHAIKEKHGVRVEKFLEIRSEPVVKADIREYAGRYEADMGHPFEIRVDINGRVEVTGSEPAPDTGSGGRSFTLKDARIEGALLTGTKVYADGGTDKFEGVFITKTTMTSPTDKGTTSYGLGVYFDPPKVAYGFSVTRVFYEAKQ